MVLDIAAFREQIQTHLTNLNFVTKTNTLHEKTDKRK